MKSNFFESVVIKVCAEYMYPSDFELYNGSLFFTAPEPAARKVFSKLMQAFDKKCAIAKIEMDSYVVDFIA